MRKRNYFKASIIVKLGAERDAVTPVTRRHAASCPVSMVVKSFRHVSTHIATLIVVVWGNCVACMGSRGPCRGSYQCI